MSTITASLLESGVKAVHTGIVAVGAHISYTSTATASSVVLLNNVPDGATLLDWWAHIVTAADGQTVKIGTSATPSGIASTFSLSQSYSVTASSTDSAIPVQLRVAGINNANQYRAGMDDLMPVRISLSDDVQPQSVQLQATFGVAISASAVFTWTLFYTTDGLNGRTTIR